MDKEINQFERAALGWQILKRVSAEETFITYKNFGNEIGVHHRAVRFVLDKIQDYCLNNQLPPITILVGDKNGIPGTGFTAWDVDNFEEGFEKVYNYNWNNLENPFSYAFTGTTEDEIVNELLNEPEKSKETYGKIKVRGTAQIIFRKALLKAYDSRCAFCDFSFSFALQAAHIIPWSKASKNQRLDVRNGILLCANHHCLFDNGLLTINDDYSINFQSNAKHKAISNYDNLLSSAFHKQRIKLPKNEKHWPNKEFLIEHRNASAKQP